MNAEYFDNLEQQLVAASQRLSDEHVVRRRRRWMGRRPLLVALVAMMCATTAFAVSDQAPWSPPELTMRADPANAPQLIGGPVPASLTSFLGVLRVPQTAADRGVDTRAGLKYFSGRSGPLRTNGIRLITSSDPAAPSLVVVPFDATTAHGTETQLMVWVPDRVDAGGTVLATRESFREPRVLGSIDGYVFGMVPDGVTHVRLAWPDTPAVEAPVERNAYIVRSPANTLRFPTVTWLDADGKSVPGLD
jgi:hypothetical protein